LPAGLVRWLGPLLYGLLAFRRSSPAFTCLFDVFAHYIRQQANLTDAEIDLLRARSVVRKLRKWQSLLHEGEVWRLQCFIASGGCRLYRFDEAGVDHTLRFAVENWWITDQESYRTEPPRSTT
jgi:hypothetical protein